MSERLWNVCGRFAPLLFCHYYLVVGLLAAAQPLDEAPGLLLVLVIDELQVHVHEHGVQDQGQLVPVDVQRALNKLFQVTKIKKRRTSVDYISYRRK
jgi:hypothetical protein